MINPTATIDYIVNWLKDYSTNSSTAGFVIGISGGLDSAVTSTLCAKTGLPVLCLEMPIHQNIIETARGRKHINDLRQTYPNVDTILVELTPTFESFIAALPETSDPEANEKSLINTRARIRMTTLYYFAGLHNYLVAGTGNKIEDFGVGFYTKYGDGGVDLSPIGDLTKTEVYALGTALGVEPDILNAAPTDGLWVDSRTDEDQLGATYPELEWAMEFSGDESNLNFRQKEVLTIYRTRHRQNLHKMKPIPVCTIPEMLRK